MEELTEARDAKRCTGMVTHDRHQFDIRYLGWGAAFLGKYGWSVCGEITECLSMNGFWIFGIRELVIALILAIIIEQFVESSLQPISLLWAFSLGVVIFAESLTLC